MSSLTCERSSLCGTVLRRFCSVAVSTPLALTCGRLAASSPRCAPASPSSLVTLRLTRSSRSSGKHSCSLNYHQTSCMLTCSSAVSSALPRRQSGPASPPSRTSSKPSNTRTSPSAPTAPFLPPRRMATTSLSACKWGFLRARARRAHSELFVQPPGHASFSLLSTFTRKLEHNPERLE